MKKHILIVDDDSDILELLSFHLSKDYNIVCASDGSEALVKINSNFDLIILDVMMPILNGFDVCKTIKKNPETSNIPVIFLTAKSTTDDEYEGLNIGAVDYIVKPISIKTLLLRVKNIVGNASKKKSKQLILGNILLDSDTGQVFKDNKKINLTKTEYSLLQLLLSSPNKIFNREELLDRVWDSNAIVTDRTVDVHIAKLRKKIETDSRIIQTHHGRGYSIEL